MNIYVGNLSYETSEDDLRTAFAAHGQVDAVRVIADLMTGRSKGFAFVEMPNAQEAQAAIQALNGKDLQGRALTVNEARPKDSQGGPRRSQSSGGPRSRW